MTSFGILHPLPFILVYLASVNGTKRPREVGGQYEVQACVLDTGLTLCTTIALLVTCRFDLPYSLNRLLLVPNE